MGAGLDGDAGLFASAKLTALGALSVAIACQVGGRFRAPRWSVESAEEVGDERRTIAVLDIGSVVQRTPPAHTQSCDLAAHCVIPHICVASFD